MASNNFKMNQNQMLGYPLNTATGQNQMMRPLINVSNNQNDSMQCSEVITQNLTNSFIPSSINQSTNNDISSFERGPDKRQKLNDGNMGSSNNNNLGLQGGNQMGGLQNQNFQDRKNDNNFKNLTTQKENEKNNQQNLLKEFDAMQFRYSNEEYSHQINRFCKRIASEKHAQEIACKFPLYKMIRAIIKKFLFNELELIFFGYVLEESKWKVDDIEVRKQAYFMNDFLNITEVKDVLDYKSVLLYLILMAYAVKFYLNDEQEMRVFNQHMHTIVKDFSQLFQYWSKIYGTTALKIIPKSLNRVYRNLSRRPNEQNKKLHEDYNALVDAIIQISPPYNNEKGGEGSAAQAPQESGKQSKGSGKNNGSSMNLQEQNQGSNLTKASMNFQSTQKDYLQKIVEQKQQEEQRKQQQSQQQLQQQSQQQQQGQANQPMQPQISKNIVNKPLTGTGLDSLGGYNQTGFSQNNFLNQQGQKFTGNNSVQPSQNQQNRELGEYQSDFINPSATGILSSDASQLQKKDFNFLQFNSNGNINENLDFISMNAMNPSNNSYNFNSNNFGLNIGMQNYPSFLGIQSSQTQFDGANKNPSFNQGKSGTQGMQLQHMGQGSQTPNLPGQSLNSQNFGLQSSGNFDANNPNAQTGNVSTNLGQSGVFNTPNIAFSNGFIGQGNSSFNSHQVGFNQLQYFQNQNFLNQQQQQQKKN
ncbi:hypothetical protein ABPG72_006862 [Tetrahymena utriculariae]